VFWRQCSQAPTRVDRLRDNPNTKPRDLGYEFFGRVTQRARRCESNVVPERIDPPIMCNVCDLIERRPFVERWPVNPRNRCRNPSTCDQVGRQVMAIVREDGRSVVLDTRLVLRTYCQGNAPAAEVVDVEQLGPCLADSPMERTRRFDLRESLWRRNFLVGAPTAKDHHRATLVTTSTRLIHDRVDDAATAMAQRSPLGRTRTKKIFDAIPLRVGQIAWVSVTHTLFHYPRAPIARIVTFRTPT